MQAPLVRLLAAAGPWICTACFPLIALADETAALPPPPPPPPHPDPTGGALSIVVAVFIAVLGGAALLGVLIRMLDGWTATNLRAIGLVLVASLATLLALCDHSTAGTGYAILAAIAGYLFGAQDKPPPPPPREERPA